MESVEERKRKFLIVAPLIVLPFLALLFYSIGGGRGGAPLVVADTTHGLNGELPSPQLTDDGSMDKFSLYKKEEKAERDSMIHRRQQNDDVLIPSLESDGVVSSPYSPGPSSEGNTPTGHPGTTPNRTIHERPEDKLEKKVADLQALLAKHAADTLSPPPTAAPIQDAEAEARIAALEARLQQQTPESTPEGASAAGDLKQVDGILNKVLDIQHPERVTDRLKEASARDKTKVFAVATDPAPITSELMDTTGIRKSLPVKGTAPASTGQLYEMGQFYEMNEGESSPANTNTISAVIHEGRTVTSGATVKIRLCQDIFISGQLVPNGTFIFGKCSFSGDRLLVNVSSLTYQGNLYPVSLAVYDLGGMAGIPIDASLNQDAAKDGSQQAIQALSVGSMDPSVGAQAASAGIEAAKRLLTKKVQVVKVTLKADYPILLVDSKNI